jgi:hypothetical protein
MISSSSDSSFLDLDLLRNDLAYFPKILIATSSPEFLLTAL